MSTSFKLHQTASCTTRHPCKHPRPLHHVMLSYVVQLQRIITMPLSSFSNDEQTATQSLDDGSGTFTTATLHGGVKLAEGWMPGSRAFEFDNAGIQGSASQYLSIDSDFTIGGRALAICASVKFTSIAKNTRIFDFGNGPGGESLQLYMSGSTDPNIPKDLVWQIYRSGKSKYVYIPKIMTLHT